MKQEIHRLKSGNGNRTKQKNKKSEIRPVRKYTSCSYRPSHIPSTLSYVYCQPLALVFQNWLFFSVLLFMKGLYILGCEFQKHLSYPQNKDRYVRTFVMNTKFPKRAPHQSQYLEGQKYCSTCAVYMIFGSSRYPCCGLPL